MPHFDTTDPFTLGYQAIVAALEAHAPFVALVPAARQVDLTEDGARLRDVVQPEHLPEALIGQAEFSITPGSSKARGALVSYPVRLATADLTVVNVNRLKWEAWRALEKAGSDLGLAFARGWRVVRAADAYSREGENRGAEGWTTVMVVQIEMAVPIAELTA